MGPMDTCYAHAAHANDADPDQDRATTTIEGTSHGVAWTLPTCEAHKP